MIEQLNYNDVFVFMKEFGIDILNRYNELIIDEPTNTYASINGCNDMEDVKMRVVYNLCRPIGKGLPDKAACRLLNKLNAYFGVSLSKQDMLLMYQELCYEKKSEEFKVFIKRGFPVNELKKIKKRG